MRGEKAAVWYVEGSGWYDDVMAMCDEDPAHVYAFMEGVLDAGGSRSDAVVRMPPGTTEAQARELASRMGAVGLIIFDGEDER